MSVSGEGRSRSGKFSLPCRVRGAFFGGAQPLLDWEELSRVSIVE